MNDLIRRFVLATSLGCSIAVVGCAAGVDQTGDARELDPNGAGSASAEEEKTAQVQQEVLVACANDVPATGFVEFPWNQVNWGESSGWKSGCVGFRVDRNLPFPGNVPAEAEAIGEFPQFEGTYTEAKADQCRASFIEGAFAQKPGPEGGYAPQDRIDFSVHAVPDIVFDTSSPTLLRIRSCKAAKRYGAGCNWDPAYNYQRIDVRAVVNGNRSTPVGPARVYAMFMNDTWC